MGPIKHLDLALRFYRAIHAHRAIPGAGGEAFSAVLKAPSPLLELANPTVRNAVTRLFSEDSVPRQVLMELIEVGPGDGKMFTGGSLRTVSMRLEASVKKVIEEMASQNAIKEFDETCYAHIQEIFRNLNHNALDAIVEKGLHEGRVSASIVRQGRCTLLEVEDNGVGMIKDDLWKIFGNGFSTKDLCDKHLGSLGLGMGRIKDSCNRIGFSKIEIHTRRHGSKPWTKLIDCNWDMRIEEGSRAEPGTLFRIVLGR
jgi:hypothetical protein